MKGFEPFLSLEASAGSGKTYALSVRYISLLFLGASPNKILTLTFTNKAANEMKNRINEVLRDLERRSELDEICRQTFLSKEEILSRKPTILKRFLKDELLISTIDSFFAKIVRKFSLYAGLLPDFAIEEDRIWEKIIKRFVTLCKKEGKFDSLISISLVQNRRLGDIFELLESFYEKEGEARLKSLKSTPDRKPVFRKLSKIRELLEKNGAPQKLIDSFFVNEPFELLKKGYIKKENLAYWQYKKYVDDDINDTFQELKEELLKFVLAMEKHLFSELAQLFVIYKKAVRSINKEYSALSFLDVTNVLFELLQDEIKKDFLYFRLDSKIEHILIDEFQDTNIVQYKILEPLFEEVVSGYGVNEFKSLFIVGDIKQSIYRFRGGAKELFGYVRDRFNLKKEVLDTNYRSSKTVVGFVNKIFEDKIEGYARQKANSEREGYLDVVFRDDLVESVLEKVEELLKKGIRKSDIALLVHKNSDANLLQTQIESRLGIKAQTSANIRLLETYAVAAIIDFLKYVYFQDELYSANFLSFLGINPVEKLDIGWFDLDWDLPKMVKEIVDRYKISSDDLDILSFIEVVSRYSDIESFLFDVENIKANSKNQESEGIKILTIHKSKGLEFPFVIVVDRLGEKNNKKSTLLYEYDGIVLQNIYQRVSGREYIDEAYKRAREKEERLEYEDMLNMHYVAFSRAKEALVIILKSKSSAMDYLGLKEEKRGKITPYKEEEKKKENVEQSIEIELKPFGLQDGIDRKKESIKSDFYSINFGLALHYCLEMMKSFDKDSLENAFTCVINRYGHILDGESLQDIYQRVQRVTDSKEFISMVEGSKLYKEQPLNYNSQRYQIDLLLEKEDSFLIVDYKSSSEVYESHIVQVELYKNALKNISDKNVEACLVYLRKDTAEIVRV